MKPHRVCKEVPPSTSHDSRFVSREISECDGNRLKFVQVGVYAIFVAQWPLGSNISIWFTNLQRGKDYCSKKKTKIIKNLKSSVYLRKYACQNMVALHVKVVS